MLLLCYYLLISHKDKLIQTPRAEKIIFIVTSYKPDNMIIDAEGIRPIIKKHYKQFNN